MRTGFAVEAGAMDGAKVVSGSTVSPGALGVDLSDVGGLTELTSFVLAGRVAGALNLGAIAWFDNFRHLRAEAELPAISLHAVAVELHGMIVIVVLGDLPPRGK